MAKKSKKSEDKAPSVDPLVSYFQDEIQTYERQYDKFLKRGRKIMKKYRDVRSPREDTITRYNLLWANVQTRLPALYARNPKVVVERRYRDNDPVGRVASEILERSIEYTLDHVNDAWQVNRQTVLDYELPGRGIVWVRYVPHFHPSVLPAAADEKRSGEQPEDSAGTMQNTAGPGEAAQPLTGDEEPRERDPNELIESGEQITNEMQSEVDSETLSYEETKLDYVYWEDYGHTWARVDDEVRAKWRRVYMDREELQDRFGRSDANPDGLAAGDIESIPLDWSPKTLTDAKIPVTRKKAIVYEIWDKRRKIVLWMVKNYHKPLDQRDDMLGLQDFFPCPRALSANLCNDDLLPTPNFTFYQDQANEIDELSTRIVSITKALKVAGVRDTSAEGLDRLLSEGVENQLVPVDGWVALKEKGGLAGVFELLPMDMIADTLGKLVEQRKQLIEDVYQLTGIADIVRGFSDPDETATAQQMKGQFSMIRMQDAQAEVQRFCRDEIRIIGQIVAQYDIETLKMISGVKLLTAAEKQQLQDQLAAMARAAQMQPMAQQPPQGPPGAPPAPHPGGVGAAPPMAQGPAPSPGAAPAPPSAGGMHPQAPSAPMTPAPGQAPISPEKQKLLEEPTWEEIEALLKNPVLREFRLDIETDSTIKMDEEAEKKARIELITAVGGFIQQAMAVGATAPEIAPMMGELLMFGVRAFKTARSIEQTFQDMMDALTKASKQPKPNPEAEKIQAQAQADMAVQQMKTQSDEKIAQVQQQAQGQQAAAQLQMESQRDAKKADIDASVEQMKAHLQADTQAKIEQIKNEFESQRLQYETASKERLAAQDNATKLKIAAMANEQKNRDHEHERAMTEMQHKHEKSMPKPEPKAA